MNAEVDLVRQFPRDFLWGTATSAHQVEGNNSRNDWWEFEQVPGHIHDQRPSGDACRHFELYPTDIKLMQQLHQNAYRFSIEWSRLEPEPGKFDPAAIEHYRQMLIALRAAQIEPLLTIHHFTNPQWLAKQGAWENSTVVDHFRRLVTLLVREYSDLVRYWVTINEPVVYAVMGYMFGLWPPGCKQPLRGFKCMINMLKAHAAAYQILHTQAKQPPQVGIAHNIRIFDPATTSWLDRKVADLQDLVINEVVLHALTTGEIRFPVGWQTIPEVRNSWDFMGLNYYSRDLVSFDWRRWRSFFGYNFPAADAELSLFGWELYPEGLYRLCQRLARYGKPIIITENGLPDDTDEQRPRFLLEHLTALHRAIAEGVPVKGYFHWSLIDNFEWAEGYRTPFGLISVDFATQARAIKDSGQLYAEICRTGALTPTMWENIKPRSNAPKKYFNILAN
jgi:beta-glucosidase